MFGGTPATADGMQLYWADFHKHLTGPDIGLADIDTAVTSAREHLDACTVLCYPFKWFRHGRDPGIRVESVGDRPEFDEWWAAVQEVSAARNDPGTFVTFPAYEWHGNRERWGDHTILYADEGAPLDSTADYPALAERLRDRDGLAIPHHTAYQVGHRGKDWEALDPAVSPVMEIYSSHGSSEGVGTPVGMAQNASMGPRTAGGSFQDGLAAGHRLGVIASNDGPGVPGTWGRGLAGIWAPELTREALLSALRARRSIGVTGDRIRLWWEAGGTPMGGEIPVGVSAGQVFVDCPQPLDHVDLIRNDRRVARYSHETAPQEDSGPISRVLLQLGWGPSEQYGPFEETTMDWQGSIEVDDGTLEQVQPRFRGFGQSYARPDQSTCTFDITTTRGTRETTLPEGRVDLTTQGFILTLRGDDATGLVVSLDDGHTVETTVGALRGQSKLYAMVDEAVTRVEQSFDLSAEAIENPDVFYHNARKIKFHPVADREQCRATVTVDLSDSSSGDAYYVRVHQTNGQVAWSSPIWIR